MSEDIEGTVAKKLSQEFSRTENRILGALARLDDFLMNPLIQRHSGTAPETSYNAFGTNQGTIEDDTQSDPYPETDILRSQTTQNSGPEVGHDTKFERSLFFAVIPHTPLYELPQICQGKLSIIQFFCSHLMIEKQNFYYYLRDTFYYNTSSNDTKMLFDEQFTPSYSTIRYKATVLLYELNDN